MSKLALRNVDTGHIFAIAYSLPLAGTWAWISEAVATEYECSPSELSMVAEADGDFVVLGGDRIVEAIHSRVAEKCA